MKKVFLFLQMILLCFFIVACTTTETVNVNIYIDGEYSHTSTVKKGLKIDFELEDDDYIFINWTDETGAIDYTNQTIDHDMDLYANAVKIGTRFLITYHLNEEACFIGNGHPTLYYAGEELDLYPPTRPNKYEFAGWYCNGKLIEKITPDMYGDLDLYDSWIDNNDYYNITYETDGATFASGELKEKAIVGGTYDIPYVTKEGYFFNGWYTDSEFKTRIYSVGPENEGDITLYAKFVEKTKDNTYVSFVGDSITTYEGLIPEDAGAYYPIYCNFPAEKTYFMLTCNEMGFHFLKNDSYSGSRLSLPNHSGDLVLPAAISDERIAHLTDGVHDPDILIIHIGTNEYSQGIEVGTFQRAIREYCKKVRKLYDDVEIYFCLHPCNNYGVNGGNNCVAEREAYNNAIIEESKPENSNYYVIDLRKAWTEQNKGEHINSNAHPNEKGFRAMADVIIEELQKTHNYD